MKKLLLATLSLSILAFGGWKEEFKKAEEEKDSVKVCQILQEASDNKDYQAMWFLAVASSIKDGCGKGTLDYKKSFVLYYKLANKDFSLGYMGLSDMYRDGKGVEKNASKSMDYMLKAANGKLGFN